MATKKPAKQFYIQGTYKVSFGKTVVAADIDEALVLAKEAQFDDYADQQEGVDIIDLDRLTGTSVSEV